MFSEEAFQRVGSKSKFNDKAPCELYSTMLDVQKNAPRLVRV
jgi:hypothetical protein